MACSVSFDVWRSLICEETWYQVSAYRMARHPTEVTTTMWPTVMQLAFCGQLVFRTSVNTKRLRAGYYKEITLR